MGDRECVEEKTPLKPHFVLIHGISGGGWCWYKLKSMICNFGYKVSCIDLKGAGLDPTDSKTILSFDEYNKPLLDFMSNLPHNEKVILVGHSAGGLSVTQATHKFPDKISLVIYVAATMLKNGFVTEQDVKDGVSDGVKCDDAYGLEFGLGVNQPPTFATAKNEPQLKLLVDLGLKLVVVYASSLPEPFVTLPEDGASPLEFGFFVRLQLH
ncbi:methylesterase 17-like [Bidens hawaiensis]|uniref:methylesterase 17-like n=1 Tax=Bidens hawaiensis TaxID=980011 RepID=UPI0040497D16